MTRLARPIRTATSLVALWLASLIFSTLGWTAAAVIVPRLFGWKSAVIISGSMLPRIHPGDVVVMPPYDHQLAIGKVVTFRSAESPGNTLTHRLQAHNPDGTWVSKGDANATADATSLHESQVLGKPALLIPYAGILTFWRYNRQNGKIVTTVGLAGTVVIFSHRFLNRLNAIRTSTGRHVRGNKSAVPTPSSTYVSVTEMVHVTPSHMEGRRSGEEHVPRPPLTHCSTTIFLKG